MGSSTESRGRDRAVVIGGGFGGLIAAGVLRHHFEHVVVLDRDTLPDIPVWRQRVPQARHLHGILVRGTRTVEKIFPGYGAEMESLGALVGDIAADTWGAFEGKHVRSREPVGINNYYASRDLIEFAMRRCLQRSANVEIRDQSTVTGLLPGEAGSIRGVVVGDEMIEADLVVDSSGRTAPGRAWLEQLGYAAPEAKKSLRVNVVYGTRRFKRDPSAASGALSIAVTGSKKLFRGGLMIAQEDGSWIVTMYGYGEDGPPLDEEGFIEYAKSLCSSEIADTIAECEPLDDGYRFKVPEIVWRDYVGAELPTGYLPFADTICALNPIHAQGMTIASGEGLILADCLKSKKPDLEKRFLKAADQWVGRAWNMTTPVDICRLNPDKPVTRGARFRDFIGTSYARAASRDSRVTGALLRVVNWLSPAPTLVRPDLLVRVALANRKH